MTPSELKRLFLAERKRFAARYKYRVGSAALAIAEVHYLKKPSRRDVAWADGTTVVFTREALSLPRANLVALVRHELAHIAEPYAMERQADEIAEVIGKQPIRYDKRGIQTVGPGVRPRPARYGG